MKKAILSVGFLREEDAVSALQAEITAAFPGHVTLYTDIASAAQTLCDLQAQQVEHLTVLPVLLLPGVEYENLCRIVAEYRPLFRTVTVARPLLSSWEDIQRLSEILLDEYPTKNVILVGHGSSHFAGIVYPALAHLLLPHRMFLGVLSGYPDFTAVKGRLLQEQISQVTLVPLMLFAGRHVKKDLTACWKPQLEAAGIQTILLPQGLLAQAAIRSLFLRHVGGN